ncbi:hypothetical protein GN958_ATG05991 [Phytophthora infestans]|uniref:Uncharacterized protein n=1 Tax=Phytophthora infestans TaxID=4787 RepID=A0A8S9UWS1_PHYIN|nr:hypothetical protein GN958_ATG05991 [Phytophthora infestans]
MTKLWHTDGEKPGSLTSMDILVRWLRAPGNYKRWKSGAKLSLLQEIAGEIKKHGAATRSPAAVSSMDGVASESVVQGVQQRCLHYYELSTVFHTTDACSGTKHGDQTTDAIDNGSAEEKQKRAKLPVQGHQKRSSDALGDNQRLKSQVNDHWRLRSSKERARLVGTNIAELTPCLKEEGEKLAQQLLQREIEHVDAMAKLQFEAELKRQELQTKCEMVLSRHKLRVAGVSEEDVESMIPQRGGVPMYFLFRSKQHKSSQQADLAKCQLESEQKREKLRTTPETLISRHQCLSVGFPEHVVDSVMPLQ